MNLCRIGWALVASAAVALGTGEALSQQKKPGKKPAEVYTDPKEAGPDFRIQGEYLGECADRGKCGAQVVALGAGKFDVYFLTGGLPGAGWDKKTRTRVSAATDSAGKVTLAGGWSGTIADGVLSGKTPDGDRFTLPHALRHSPTEGLKPPPKAVVLFDGSSADAWKGGKLVEGNLLSCGCTSKKGIATGKLHLEFRTPFEPKRRGQGRGNSGVYIHGREIQVLDSFGLEGKKDECGAFYGSAKPAVNMCYPPLSWQTYDVEIGSDRKGGMLATVYHNGVKVHEHYPIKGQLGKETPILLQNHGNPVVYRNIWYASDLGETP